MKIQSITTILWALALAASIISANAQFIVNGSFETPSTETFLPISGGEATLPGWTVGLTGIDVAGVNNPFINGAAYDGLQYIDLDGTPGPGRLTQSFATAPGEVYTLSFAYANAYPNQASASASVRVFDEGGDRLTGSITHSTSLPGNLDWLLFSGQFTANAATTTFEISSLSANNSFGGILLDAVQVVPEPGPIALFLVATTMLLLSRIRRANH